MKRSGMKTVCEDCVNYVYDEDYGTYACMVSLDEDEMSRFMSRSYAECPYYHCGDEYRTTVKKQI